MDCNTFKKNLVAYLHGELDKNDIRAIHQHLSTCDACIEEEMEFIKTHRVLEKYPFEALPENFDTELHRKIKLIRQPEKKVSTGFRRIVYAVAATLLITIGVEFFIYQFLRTSQQPAQLTDVPTTQVIFESSRRSSDAKDSWKQRYMEKYFRVQEKHSTKKI